MLQTWIPSFELPKVLRYATTLYMSTRPCGQSLPGWTLLYTRNSKSALDQVEILWVGTLAKAEYCFEDA